MVWGIIGALDKEIELIKNEMAVEKTEERYGSKYYIGAVGSEQVVAVCSSIGKINAAVCASTIIREFGAQVVINVGIAGCASTELGILDVAISDEVAFHDQDPSLFERFYPFKRSFAADKKLLELCVKAIETIPDRDFAYKIGKIATGDVFVEDKTVKADIVRRLSPLCVEMEGASIGQVAAMNGTPFLVLRSMSDNADDSAGETYDNWMEVAAHHSAGILLKMLKLANAG